MWTPKRLVLLAGGFAVFLSAYFGYAFSLLGGIDGLPPLPESFLPDQNKKSLPAVGPRGNKLEAKIREAFGEKCPELGRPVRLEMHSKSMVLTADQFKPTDDGRLYLAPFSLAVFGKDKNDGKAPDINTIRAQVAYLTFDRPVSNLSEMSGRKIVRAEIRGDIQIVNNRRTPQTDDDLCLYIGTGPLFYQESDQKVWTDDVIHLTDWSSKPKPVEVRGRGMVLDLLVDQSPVQPGVAAASRNKGKNSDQISGVKKITLLSNVDMSLYVDAKSGFPGGTPPPAAKTTTENKAVAKAPPPEKAHVTIKTPGRFEYEIFKDHDQAHFSVPEVQGTPTSPQNVDVDRHQEQLNLWDHLVCQHLELRVHRKENGAGQTPAVEGTPEQGVEIETAHATGPEVILTSDAEDLEAHGNDFFYDARRVTTTLKGEPRMIAIKSHNTIRARELQIQEQKLPTRAGQPPQSFQQATAIGPVTIDLIDKDKPQQQPSHASCTDNLISTKDGPFDLLILVGAARLTDDEHNQHLQAETIRIWLNPDDHDAPAKADKASANMPAVAGGRKPHHIEAKQNVAAWSAEMSIHDTDRLVVWFKDVPLSMLPDDKPPKDAGQHVETRKSINPETTLRSSAQLPPGNPAAPLPAAQVARSNPAPAPSAPVAPVQAPPPPAPAAKSTPGQSTATAPANKQEHSSQPIDLEARSVEAWVLRCGPKNQVERLWTEGKVKVRQDPDPAKPDEKGVDVRGDTLEMTYHPEGNFLVVTGDLAELRLNNLYIIGPEVNIDQATNKAWVNGIGAMEMDSDTDFQGNKVERTVPLTVHWNTSMFFDGKSAEFHGGIQAEQDNARLAGQRLTVFFDRPISLKEGNKSDQKANVQSMVCDRDVHVEETIYEKGKLVRFQRIQTPVLSMDTLPPDEEMSRSKTAAGSPSNSGNEVRASGPGNVRILQRGDDSTDPTTMGTRPAGSQPRDKKPAKSSTDRPAAEEEEIKLTYVQFLQNMYANSKTNRAIFLGNVRVLHMPVEDPNKEMNKEIDLDVVLSKIPKGALYLRSDRLDVLNRGEKGHAQQEMMATGRCVVQAQEFWGRAHIVTYNEAKDQLIFLGEDDKPAVLFKVESQGAKPQKIQAKKILYLRKTGDFKIDDTESLDGHQ